MPLVKMFHTRVLNNVTWYLLQEVALEVNEVVGLDDVGAALAAKHTCKEGLHGWRALPCIHHGISYLQFSQIILAHSLIPS